MATDIRVPGPGSSCLTCRHYRGTSRITLDPRCRAFPRRIPGKILSGWIDHRQPVAGDNGVRYEPGEHWEYT